MYSIFRHELFYNRIEISGPDSFQGIEKDVIIISALKPFNGFCLLDTREKLGIAMTRAKNSLVVFGNFQYVLTVVGPMASLWQSLIVDAKRRDRFCDLDGEFDAAKIQKCLSS